MVTGGGELGKFDRWSPVRRVYRESMRELREGETRGQGAMIGMAALEVGRLEMRSYGATLPRMTVCDEPVHGRNGQVRDEQEGQEGRPDTEGCDLKHPSIHSHLR